MPPKLAGLPYLSGALDVIGGRVLQLLLHNIGSCVEEKITERPPAATNADVSGKRMRRKRRGSKREQVREQPARERRQKSNGMTQGEATVGMRRGFGS